MATYSFPAVPADASVVVFEKTEGATLAGLAGRQGTQVASGTAAAGGGFVAELAEGKSYVARYAVGDGFGFAGGSMTSGATASSGSAGRPARADTYLGSAASAFRATMDRGYHSTCLELVGDSTGDEQDEWFGKLGLKLAARYPGYSVLWKAWNNTAQTYDAPVSFSTGTFNGGGDRYVQIDTGSVMRYVLSNTLTGDIQVTVKLQPAAGWAPGGAAASRTIAARYNASGTSRAWWFYLDETGKLKWTWSSSGSADAGTCTSTVAVPFTTEPGWVRVQFDVDNGATGNDCKFFTSTDGQTWTQLGTTVTTAGTTTLSGSTYDYQLGARNGTPTDFGPGKYYFAQVMSGFTNGGTPQVPFLPELWDQSTGTQTLGGAPIILMLDGSQSGQNISYFNDSTRRLKLHEMNGQQLLLLSDGHNEGTVSGYSWRGTYGAWLTDIKNRVQNTPVVCIAQNPTLANVDPWKGRELRGAAIMALAQSNAGCYGLDVWPQFARDQSVLATQLEDNIHPGPTGSELWAQYVYDRLALG